MVMNRVEREKYENMKRQRDDLVNAIEELIKAHLMQSDRGMKKTNALKVAWAKVHAANARAKYDL